MVEEGLFDLPPAGAGASGKQPCGCNETQAEGNMELDLFGATEGGDPASELEGALAALSSGTESGLAEFGGLSLEEELEFGGIGEGSTLTLEDILSFAERNPGLKITFSF